MFFHNSRHDAMYPVSRIRWIDLAEHANRKGLQSVLLDEGERVWIYPSTVNEITQLTGQVIPAAPETYYLYVHDEPEWVTRTHVIAWAIGVEETPLPITVDGTCDGFGADHPLYIQTPDGAVTSPTDRSWPTLEAFTAWVIKEAEETAAKAAAAQEIQS